MSLTRGNQTLNLTGLRFNTTLGLLPHELTDSQPILVDAELNMCSQPMMPRDTDRTPTGGARRISCPASQRPAGSAPENTSRRFDGR